MRVHKETPLFQITLRKFERPHGDVVRKFLMSIGLLQPGDSREDIVGLFECLLEARKKRSLLKVSDMSKLTHSSPPNVRRNLKRLKELGLVEKFSGGYRIREWASISELIKELKEKILGPIFDRIEEYGKAVDLLFEDVDELH